MSKSILIIDDSASIRQIAASLGLWNPTNPYFAPELLNHDSAKLLPFTYTIA